MMSKVLIEGKKVGKSYHFDPGERFQNLGCQGANSVTTLESMQAITGQSKIQLKKLIMAQAV